MTDGQANALRRRRYCAASGDALACRGTGSEPTSPLRSPATPIRTATAAGSRLSFMANCSPCCNSSGRAANWWPFRVTCWAYIHRTAVEVIASFSIFRLSRRIVQPRSLTVPEAASRLRYSGLPPKSLAACQPRGFLMCSLLRRFVTESELSTPPGVINNRGAGKR